jgi:hypothetical protein
LRVAFGVSGIETGEQIIVRMDVLLDCGDTSKVSGNIDSRVDAALVSATGDTTPDPISSGTQTIPLKQAGNIGLTQLDATKTATGSFDRTTEWDITKAVAPATWTGYAGDEFTSEYDVSVDKTVTDGNYAVSGTVTVSSPATATGPVTFTIEDRIGGTYDPNTNTLSGGTAVTPTCSTYTLQPGESTNCPYSHSFGDTNPGAGTNYAIITPTTEGFAGLAVEDDYDFSTPTEQGEPGTINVTDTFESDDPLDLGSASDDKAFPTYERDFSCPTDPTLYDSAGKYTESFDNVAEITETGEDDDATVTVNCTRFDASVVKDVETSFDRTHTWSVVKSVSPTWLSGVAGDELEWDYDVVVDKTTTDSNFAISGTITVTNPAPFEASFTVTDEMTDGDDNVVATPAVDCDAETAGDQNTVTVAANSSAECTYSASFAEKPADGFNTATVTSSTVPVGSATTEPVPYSFADDTAKISVIGEDEVNVEDAFDGADGVLLEGNPISSDTTFEYSRDYTCSTEQGDYTNGTYEVTFPNTATIRETEQSSSANVTVTCYAPVVTKTAAGTYDRTWTWTVAKSVSPTWQSGYAGDALAYTWTVTAGSTELPESNFEVAGTITIDNPSDEDSMTVDVVDELNDLAKTAGDVDCDSQTAGDQSTGIVIAAGGSVVCSYTVAPSGRTATKNTATVTLNEGDFTDDADVAWDDTKINDTANLSDEEIGLDEDLVAGTVYEPWTGDDQHVCSTDPDDYTDGSYTGSDTNLATLDPSAADNKTATATTEWTCYRNTVTVSKTVDGGAVNGESFQFSILEGASQTSSTWTVVATATTDAATGEIGPESWFAQTNPAKYPLKPGTYALCEFVPTGYGSSLQLQDGPDADSIPGEYGDDWFVPGMDIAPGSTTSTIDNSTVCLYFTVVVGGGNYAFTVDNDTPGMQRTIGFWKNHTSCDGSGNQEPILDRTLYAAEATFGEWIVIGTQVLVGGPTEDDATDCEEAVALLDKRNIATGKKSASDARYNLAAQLLAYRLNETNGWGTPCATAAAAATAAQNKLASIGFNGTQTNKISKALSAELNGYASTLDRFNNDTLTC